MKLDIKVGIYLNCRFNHLKSNVILDRLVFRKHYGLAIQIAKHLKLPESRILEHWAFHKVVHDKSNVSTRGKSLHYSIELIILTFNLQTTMTLREKFPTNYVCRAFRAFHFVILRRKPRNRDEKILRLKWVDAPPECWIDFLKFFHFQLLEFEPKSSLQVPLLLKLGENKKALLSATNSGDTDLVYTVLLQLKETTQLADFQMIIRNFPMAQNLYKKYCHLNSKSALQEIFNQEDDFVAQAEFALREGISREVNISFIILFRGNR